MKTLSSRYNVVAFAVIFSVLVFVGCDGGNKQSSGGNSETDPRIVGSWVGKDGSNWLFESDGTGKKERDYYKYIIEYAFFSNKIIIMTRKRDSEMYVRHYDYIFLANGRTFIIYHPLETFWLTKND